LNSDQQDPPQNGGQNQSALVLTNRPATPLSEDITLQRLWLSLTRRRWRSLAVIGASKGLPTLEVSNLLAEMASWYRGESSCVVDFRDTRLRLVEHEIQQLGIQMQAEQSDRAIIALRSIFENPTALLFAQAVDSVVLCVGIGTTHVASAEKTIDEIGRDRFLGSIVITPTLAQKLKK
jgi:hypothetical protein